MKQYLLQLFFLLFAIQIVIAQQFPVQVIPQTIPPRPVVLSDYANASSVNDKVRVQLILNDLTELNREVRLKLFIEGQGINAQSNDVVVGATPIFLEGGVATTLGTAQLAPYFNLQNLQGISPGVYGNSLPEGSYSFCFEVYDLFTGNVVSAKTCTNFVLFDNDPPLLNLPLNAAGIQEMNPLNIVFQWTPRHINVSNVQYELIVSEIWDLNIDPQAAFLSSPPIFQTTTTQTTFIYDGLQPSLIPGKRYGWRVRAFAAAGAEEIGVFTNNGFSEIFYFDYQTQCDEPLFPDVDELTNRSAKLIWQGNFDHLDYTVKYREKDAESEWYDLNTPREYADIDNLNAETTYEYKIQGNCMFGSYGETFIQEFTTLSDEASSYQGCAIEPNTIEIDNQEVLAELFINDKFTAGDFPVTVLQVDSGTAPFSGGGYVVVPWLGDTKISVAFTGIQINTDMQLLSGNVETTYDADWGSVEFIDDIFEVFEGDNDLTNINLEFDIPTEPDGAFQDYIEVNPDGTITITDPTNGNTVDYPGGDDVMIVDTNPDGTSDAFVVDENGNVTEAGEIAPGGPIDAQNTPGFDINGNITQLSALGIKVTFIDDTDYAYGFDQVPDEEYNKLNGVYDRITDADGNPYDIIHKAIKKDVTEGIKATLDVDNDSIYSRLVFKTEQGLLLPHTRSGSTLTINVKGLYGFENELVYATLLPEQEDGQQTIAGSFRLWHLSEREANITVVRVNGATLPSNYEQELNSIYGKAVINFTYANVIDYTVAASLYGGDNLLVGESGALSTYTSEQSAIISDFKSVNGYDVNTYYLFVFGDDVQPSRSIAGFMPLKRQYGFIFNPPGTPEENTNDRIKVMAHELGHGIFGLEHPFSQFNTTQDATDWVMDYGDGTNLVHTDWAQMHNPDFNFYLFQDDEDGEQISNVLLATRFIETLKAYQIESDSELGSLYTDNDGIVHLSTVVLLQSFLQDDVYATQQHIQTTDGDDFYIDLVIDKKIDHTINYSNLIDDLRQNEFSSPSGSEKRFYHPYNGEVSQDDIGALTSELAQQPNSDGILIIVPETYYTVFKASVLDFNNDSSKKEIWRNNLNNNVVTSNFEQLQKYPTEALKLTSIDSRISLYYTLLGTSLSSSNSPWNRFWGGADEEIIFVSLLNSIISDQGTDDNTTLFQEFVNDDKYVHIFSDINDNEVRQLLYKAIGKWVSKSDQTVVYNILVSILSSTEKTDEKENLIVSILQGIDTAQLAQSRYNVVQLFDSYPGSLRAWYNSMSDLDKEYYVHYLTKWATLVFADQYRAIQNNFELCTSSGCIYEGIDQNTNSRQWREKNLFNLKYIGFFDECGDTITSNCQLLNQTSGGSQYNPENKPYYFVHEVRSFSQVDNNIIIKPVYYKYGNPLSTFVNISFHENYNYANIQEGQNFTVPLIWADHFANKHNATLDAAGLDIALRTTAIILTTAFSGGTATAPVIAALALETGGLVLTINENDLRGLWGNETYQEINNSYQTIELLTGMGALANGARKLNFSNLRNFVQNANSIENLKNLRSSLKSVYQKLSQGMGRGGRFLNYDANDLLKLLYEIDIKASFLQTANNISASINNNLKAVIISASIEYEIATLKYLDNLNYKNLLLTPSSNAAIITNVSTDWIRLGSLDDIYIMQEGIAQNKKVDVFRSATGNLIYLKVNDLDEVFDFVTAEIVSQQLANSYLNSLITFGKTEIEILNYFKNYHNGRSSYRWLNEIEDLKTLYPSLNDSEIFSLWGYTTNFYYGDLNYWLRKSLNSNLTESVKQLLDNALSKLPNYSGQKVYRGIAIDPGNLQDFLLDYQVGAQKTWNDFTSCGGSQSASFSGRPEVNIIFEIQHINGKDISRFADGIQYGDMGGPEILIKSGSTFESIAIPEIDSDTGKWIIKLVQTN